MKEIIRLYRKSSINLEYCFYIETSASLDPDELEKLKWLLGQSGLGESTLTLVKNEQQEIIEIGPRLNFETFFSTNAVSICHSCGIEKVVRLERSRRYLLPKGTDYNNRDRMTECIYPKPIDTFETRIVPEEVYVVQLIEEGKYALEEINENLGLGMDEWDIDFYYKLFVETIGKNPTNVECFQLGQANSEHSRHWFFNGKMIIDGQEMSETLFEVVKSTLTANPSNSIIAFKDNSSAIAGHTIHTLIPQHPGNCSSLSMQQCTYHLIFTAETHNFPTGVAPFPGAETGTGGRIRDVQATGIGALVIAGTAGYCVGNLNIPDYQIPGENSSFVYPKNLASPIDILIGESNGASDYGNKFGEPVIQGFVRTFGNIIPNGERREWIKPIMFTAGVGQIDDKHLEKEKPEKGMKIVQVGGPAYRIGIGGSAASSMSQGENREELDFNAVQRGDAEMEQKMNRVIRACVEMGNKNPILSIHDQGAAGPCNVLTEIVEPAGGRINIRKVKLGDKTMSVLEIWGAEYQERNALLINPDRINEFQTICQREKVNCEILGEITGNGKIVVHDSRNNSTPVNLDLSQILSNMPQKTFHSEHLDKKLTPLVLQHNLTVEKALKLIFRLPSVGSKGYLVRKVDRSVTGLVARQQCCGPLQLPVSDVAVVAQSHFGLTGAATSVGEQPIKMLVNPEAGARMAVGEALTNIMSALISDIEHIKCSVNWMWAAKLSGEGSILYDAAVAMRDLMIDLGIAVDGGKDSLSMAAKVDLEIVKAPGQMVVSAYATMSDITKVVTPDIKQPDKSRLMLIDLASGKRRLSGSALAQAFGQIGNESPDVDNPKLLLNAFKVVQELIRRNLILSSHDISDGGVITTLVEMAMAGNCGIEVNLPKTKEEVIAQLFSEELGLVLEYLPENAKVIDNILKGPNIPYMILGSTKKEKQIIFSYGNQVVLNASTSTLLNWWESTSDQLEEKQMNPDLAKEQSRIHNQLGPVYKLTFHPVDTLQGISSRRIKPKVAVIREEGSNGDREMTSAFYAAGFETWDVTMTDLLNGNVQLSQFRGIVFVGGFSYADVLDSAKGWAGVIKFNPELREMFDNFYDRPDTFSLGVCNGCQLMTLLGWIPFRDSLEDEQPRFIQNLSERFESRWTTVKIMESPSIMLKDMAGSSLGVWIAHGEGRLYHPDKKILSGISKKDLTPLVYVDDEGLQTEQYPFNPNGSQLGIAALCSPNGRHLAMMPHPERSFRLWQWPWMSEEWKHTLQASPWLQMFQNAKKWCERK